jgi:hypothetical protein
MAERFGGCASKTLARRGHKRAASHQSQLHADNCRVPPIIRVSAVPTAGGWTCLVDVDDASGRAFAYKVDVDASDVERYGRGSTVEDLVERSFTFLLEREPPSSILREFQLPDIERYFPEYPRVISA